MARIAVVDFGTGNLRSVQKAIEHVAGGSDVEVTDDPDIVAQAERVVFPGQGAIGTCVRTMMDKGLRQVVEQAMHNKPFLGICIGLQALYEFSEEGGGTEGLGLFKGKVRHFDSINGSSIDPHTGMRFKVPHMGWNNVAQTQDHPLWQNIPQDSRFYFVHSYCALSERPQEVYGETEYSCNFTAAAGRDNVFAVQFHPEKSQHAGLTLLENFVNWDGAT